MSQPARSLYIGIRATATLQPNDTAFVFVSTKDAADDWDDWAPIGKAFRVDMSGVGSTSHALQRLGSALMEFADGMDGQ